MRYRRLGRWGVQVSEIGLGSWLTYGGPVDERVSADCLSRAAELGVNFIDTANVYSGGAAEEAVGRWMAGQRRDSLVLATKVYFPMGEGPNDRGLSRKHVFEQCHGSLRRLKTEYVDLYQCHRFDRGVPLEETCRAMDDLVRQGTILYWGVSEWAADQIEEAVKTCREAGWAEPVSNQPEYNALQARVEEDVLPTTARLGLGNVVWSPLAQGVLTGKYTSATDVPVDSRAAGEEGMFMGRYLAEAVLESVREFASLASGLGCTPAQLGLAWCLRRPEVSSVIVGATRVSQVEENVAAAELELGPEEFEAVDRVLGPARVNGI